MLKLKYEFNGAQKELEVNFEYTKFNPDDPQKPRDTLALTPTGMVTMGDPPVEVQTYAYGQAMQHHLDTFNRTKGRKIAFGRLLQNYLPDKKERAIVWMEFLKIVGV